jgi:hypothetical protein
MASRNSALRLASLLLTKDNVGIAAEIIDKHVDAALAKKDKPRLSELFDLQKLVENVKAGDESQDET